MLTLETIICGHIKNIVAIKDCAQCEVIEYIESLDENVRIKLLAVMSIMANMGMIRNDTKFRYLENKIYEFKAKQARIFCFRHHEDVICTHGTDKPKPKRLRVEINKAVRIMQQFIDERR